MSANAGRKELLYNSAPSSCCRPEAATPTDQASRGQRFSGVASRFFGTLAYVRDPSHIASMRHPYHGEQTYMVCTKCGNTLVEVQNFCSKCGQAVPVDPGALRAVSPEQPMEPAKYLLLFLCLVLSLIALESLHSYASFGAIASMFFLGFFAFSKRPSARKMLGAIGIALIAVLITNAIEGWQLRKEQRRQAAIPQQSPSESRKQAQPVELDASAVLLRPRSALDGYLGKAKPERVADCTAGEQGFVYPDDSYVCVKAGMVTLLSYQLKKDGANAELALAALNIPRGSAPRDFGSFKRWSSELGNELTLSTGSPISNLLYFGHTVVIDMHGRQEAVEQNEAPSQKRETPAERTRVSFVVLLNIKYRQEGRHIIVEAQGKDQDVLVLSSSLISDGSHTLDAARRETIDCPNCMLRLKKLKFRRVIISGEEYQESYSLE